VDSGEYWSAIAGARSSRVRFDTRDRYIVPGLNVHSNVGRGFETPTFTELA